MAKFVVHYECIVFKPFKGEVLDAVVTSVSKARPAPPPCHPALAATCPSPRRADIELPRSLASSRMQGRRKSLCPPTRAPSPPPPSAGLAPPSSARSAEGCPVASRSSSRTITSSTQTTSPATSPTTERRAPGGSALGAEGARIFPLGRATKPGGLAQVRICKDAEVRVRIVGTRHDANGIVRPMSGGGAAPGVRGARAGCPLSTQRAFLTKTGCCPLPVWHWDDQGGLHRDDRGGGRRQSPDRLIRRRDRGFVARWRRRQYNCRSATFESFLLARRHPLLYSSPQEGPRRTTTATA